MAVGGRGDGAGAGRAASAPLDAAAILADRRERWLVTGCAGFIGSHLVEALLRADQDVVGLDNLSTGHRRNLAEVQAAVGPSRWARFRFLQGDVRDPSDCGAALRGARYVLHQAALGSVPRSIADPLASHASNVDGFVTLLDAARRTGVERFVYASSSSVYGDHPALPKVESQVGAPLSPYAATKRINEVYADVYARTYGIGCVGLRYFNVFGPRQDPAGPYAAVIPRWTSMLLRGETPVLHGDGTTSRDFCYVANAVQANLLAALAPLPGAHRVFNVAVGESTSLDCLYRAIVRRLVAIGIAGAAHVRPRYEPFRAGDVRHSLADIGEARRVLGYRPVHRLADGLHEAVPWYVAAERTRRAEPRALVEGAA